MREINSFVLTLLVAFFNISLSGQTNLRVMSYNIMHYPYTQYYNTETDTFSDRAPVLRAILEEIEPDIFFVCELQEDQAADYLLQEALWPISTFYDKAIFTYNHSSSYTDLQQMLYYNTEKLTLTNQDFIYTNIRDINHYTLSTNTTPSVVLEVFVAHLKASQGETNEDKRLQMSQAFTNYLETLPEESYVLFGGDFNFYNSYESGFQELMDNTNAIELVDPINASGIWHNNADFKEIHTQSPLQTHTHFQTLSGGPDGVTGGMDDRFDFILLSENFLTSQDIHYVEDSYKAYGNNGNCFNENINDPSCSGEYTAYTRDLLFNMSDHIPVVLDLELTSSAGFSDYIEFSLLGSNYCNEVLQLEVDSRLLQTSVEVYNQIGQVVLRQDLSKTVTSLNISRLERGIYYLRVPQFSVLSPLKFIKK